MIYEDVSKVSIDFLDGGNATYDATEAVSVQVGVGGTSINVRMQDAENATHTMDIYPMGTIECSTLTY